MLKSTFINFAIIFTVILSCEGTIVKIPRFENQYTLLGQQILRYENEERPMWQTHAVDFLNLINFEKVLSTAVRFIDDPEVMRFIGFLLSPKFKDMIWELESMEEFKEAFIFLTNKGYDVQSVIDYLNTGLSLPSFNNPQKSMGYSKGVSGFIAAMIGTLPMDDMKELWKTKLENYSEVADFFEVIKSPEFMDIMERMFSSKKFYEFKSTFEEYGVDFNFICDIINELFGDEYKNFIYENEQNVFMM